MIKAFILILVLLLVSIFCRWLAFNRMDSVALDLCIAAFIYNLFHALSITDSMQQFLDEEMMRCIVLFLFAFIVGAVHRHYSEMCQALIRNKIDKAKMALEFNRRNRMDDDEFDETDVSETLYFAQQTILDQAKQLAEKTIFVCYSAFIDRFSYNYLPKFLLKKKKQKGTKGFRPNKTAVRQGLADMVNALEIEGVEVLKETDFNIDEKNQMIGLCLFDLMELRSVLVALRIL